MAFGGLAAWGVFRRFSESQWAVVVSETITLGLIAMFRLTMANPMFISSIGFTFFAFSAALWTDALVRSSTTTAPFRVMPAPITIFLAMAGRYSFFVYLFHLFILEAMLRLDGLLPSLSLGFWSAFAVATIVSVGCGAVSWRIFEQPIIDFGRRWERRSVDV